MFYFRAGNIETRTPWNEPTMMAFKSWWGQLKKATNLDDYKVYLVGSFAEKVYGANIKTNDIDIILRGEIKSYPNLKDVLDKAMILGFQNKLLIDIKWQNQNLYQEHLAIRKKCQRIQKTEKFTRIKNFTEYEARDINTPRTITRYETKYRVTPLPCGLYQMDGYDYRTIAKAKKRVQEDIYSGVHLDIKNAFR
jgi:hypothetical protein